MKIKKPELTRRQWLQIILILAPATLVGGTACLFVGAVLFLSGIKAVLTPIDGAPGAGIVGMIFGAISGGFFLLPCFGLYALWMTTLKPEPEAWLSRPRLWNTMAILGMAAIIVAGLLVYPFVLKENLMLSGIGLVYIAASCEGLGMFRLFQYLRLKLRPPP